MMKELMKCEKMGVDILKEKQVNGRETESFS